jgi:hypothetical protein
MGIDRKLSGLPLVVLYGACGCFPAFLVNAPERPFKISLGENVAQVVTRVKFLWRGKRK